MNIPVDNLKSYENKGFTLIEILVAMLLLSVSFVLILQLFSGGLKAVKLSEDYNRAIFIAREKMEEAIAINQFTDGDIASGETDDGYQWSVKVVDTKSDVNMPFSLSLFKVSVNIYWVSGIKDKHFDLNTLKVAPKIK